MKTLKMTDKRGSMRTKALLATMGCLSLVLATIATAPVTANAQGSRYVLTVRNQSHFQN